MIYHKEIGFPPTLKFPQQKVQLYYTQHSVYQRDDKYRDCEVPAMTHIQQKRVVEVETFDNTIIKKLVVRINYDDTYHMVLVLAPLNENWLEAKVITFWLNRMTDLHPSLDKTKYSIPA
jgi:hypothetical protein